MYTNPLYLKISNLKERGAVIAILASITKLAEKERFISGAAVTFKAKSPKFGKHSENFLTKNLCKKFKAINIKFIEKNSLIITTITPK